MCARSHETDIDMGALDLETGVKGRPSPPLAVCVDQRANRGFDTGLPQRVQEDCALPIAVKRRAEMLRRAAAAHAKITANRRRPFGAGAQDFYQSASLSVDLRKRLLAGKRAGNGNERVAEARQSLAAGTEPFNR